jgi:hypothetical protein
MIMKEIEKEIIGEIILEAFHEYSGINKIF